MLTSVAVYLVISIAVMMSVSAWDNGARWDTKQCVFLGIFWVASVPLMLALYLYRKYIKK